MLVTDMAFALRDEELGKEQTELPATELPLTEKEIEAAKRELRFVRRSTVNKLHQTMEKLKRFLEFRGSRAVMRLLLEQVFETWEEIRTMNFRFFALLEAAEQQREQTAAERLENEVEDLRQRIDEHLKERINEPPSSIASIPLSLRKVSAPKGIVFGKPAMSADMNINQADIEFGKPAMSADMNINQADIETAKSEQALLLRQEEEKTILRKELERKELEAKLQWKEQEFKREIQQIKLEHEKRLEELKIEELDKRHRVEKKIASIERRHQLAASRMGDDLSQNGGHRKDIESLPQESVKDKVDRMFSKMGDSSAQKGSGIRTASQPSDPILKVAEAILKTQKPNINPFSGDYGKYSAFRVSFKQLEEQGYYNENELLNLLLTNVKGEAETALQGILPNSSEYYEAWRILEKRFGDPIKIVQSYRRALKSSPSVLEKNAAQLRSLTDKVTSLISVFKSLGRTGDLLSDSYVEDVLVKLPTLLKTRWIDIIKAHPERRMLRSFGELLEDRAHTWDIAQGNLDPSSSKLKSEGKSSHKTRSFKTDMTSLVSTCPFHFKKGHSVSQCRMFKRLFPI